MAASMGKETYDEKLLLALEDAICGLLVEVGCITTCFVDEFDIKYVEVT